MQVSCWKCRVVDNNDNSDKNKNKNKNIVDVGALLSDGVVQEDKTCFAK